MSAIATTDPTAAAQAWLAAFDRALSRGDAQAATALFGAECHWRDIVAFGDDFLTVSGREDAKGLAERALTHAHPRDFRLAEGRTPPRRVTRTGRETIEFLFAFTIELGTGVGVAHLTPDTDGELRVWTFMTALDALNGAHADIGRAARPSFTREFGQDNWLDQRRKTEAYESRDPAVLVVGGGQAGLAAAARLGEAGLDTLVIDRQARTGDNWRTRYGALVLHNQTNMNHLPYLPFPGTWPRHIPKDKLANWFEAYAESMELNVWNATQIETATFDEVSSRWTITLRTSGGGERVVRPYHVVFATGVSSIPVTPKLPGLETFTGVAVHSGAFTDGEAWRGRRAIVVGTGNSAHDVAQDLVGHGASVTMVQRSPTYVISLEEAQGLYNLYNEGLPVEDADLVASGTPYEVLRTSCQQLTATAREADQPLLDRLAARGFRLTFGEDESGFQMMYLRRGGGYYFNIGCSDLIADGTIGLVQHDAVVGYEAGGMRLRDGTLVEADLVVLATGFKNQQDTARAILGDAIADKIGPVWGFDGTGELRNMWRPTPQEGLWFTGGGLGQCRIYSKYLALQIKSRIASVVRDRAAKPPLTRMSAA